jgi:predicted TIM-barrel fold metal-dependent hydrolase
MINVRLDHAMSQMRCDSHVHIVGAIERYPQVATRTYQAGPAPLDELQRRGRERDVARFVLVQPSFYGIDNTLLLEGLDALRGNGRGVAVIDPDRTPPDELEGLARRGVCGLRLNHYSTAAARQAGQLDHAFRAMADVARPLGWHVEVIAACMVLAQSAAMIAGAGVPVVIDHYGLYGTARPDSPEGQRLLELFALPHVWVKLSAPYRVGNDPMNTRPDKAWLDAILGIAADRCVWGSDWPHTPPHDEQHDGARVLPYRAFSYARLVDDFIEAVGSPELGERILHDNPARLYGFA